MIKILKKKILKFLNDEDVKYIFKYSKFKLYHELLFAAMGFLILYLFANFINIEFYGTYLFIISIESFFSIFSFIGINQSMLNSVANGYDYYFISSIKKTFKFSISGSVVIFIFSIFYFFIFNNNIEILISLIIILLFFPFSNALLSYHWFLEGKEKFRISFIYKTVNLIINTILLLFLIFFINNLVLFFFLSNLFQLLINLRLTKLSLNFIDMNTFDKSLEKKANDYSKFLVKYNIIALICLNLNSFLVGLFYGPKDLVYYTIGVSLIYRLISLVKPTFSVLLPKYSKEDTKISKIFIIFTIICSILLLLLINLFLPIYLLIFFPLYVSTLSYGILTSLILLISPIEALFTYYFKGKANKEILKKIILIPNITDLILIFPLFIIFSVYGLILSDIIRHIITLVIFSVYISKKENMNKK